MFDDARESPSADLVKLLKERKANIYYFDPYVSAQTLEDYAGVNPLALDHKSLENVDATVIMTDHDNIDWNFVVKNSNLVIDTRNATKDVLNYRDKIVKL